jgi:hypothetical protein
MIANPNYLNINDFNASEKNHFETIILNITNLFGDPFNRLSKVWVNAICNLILASNQRIWKVTLVLPVLIPNGNPSLQVYQNAARQSAITMAINLINSCLGIRGKRYHNLLAPGRVFLIWEESRLRCGGGLWQIGLLCEH